ANIDAVYRSTAVKVFFALRDGRDYDGMVKLFDRLPEALRRTRQIREMLGFAMARIDRLETATAVLKAVLTDFGPSSATYTMLVRISKEQWQLAKREENPPADLMLQEAIEAYVAGFNSNPKTAIPGVNALTLMEWQKVPVSRQLALLPPVRSAAVN